MPYELEGKLHKIFPTETKGDNFQVREFIVAIEGQYPQFAKFQLSGDKCGLISEMAVGWTVKVFFNIVGREWQEKYFTNLAAWKITVTGNIHTTSNTHQPTISDAEVIEPEDDYKTPF